MCGNFRITLPEVLELSVPLNLFSMTSQIVVQKFLVLALLQHQNKRIGTQTLSNLRKIHFATHLSIHEQTCFSRDCAFFNRSVRQINLLVDFERTGMHPDGL